MRTLKFIVDGQILTKDPGCDFENLVPGSEGYLQAEFTFSQEWKDCTKVVKFHYRDNEYPPQSLDDGKSCMIPNEATAGRAFYITVLGKRGSFKITTNDVGVVQKGGEL